jgi:hypothetical protein
VLLLLGALFSGCAARPAERIELLPIAVPALRASIPGLAFETLRGFELRADDPAFGGFSGVLADAQHLTLLSDRGTLWQMDLAALARDGRQRMAVRKLHLVAPDAPPDAEDVAPLSDGTLLIATESGSGLYRLAPGTSRLSRLSPPPPGWLHHPGTNLGLETVATLADGRVLAISEGLTAGHGAVRAGLLAGGSWRPLSYPVSDGWAPVGADRFEDDILVLERRFGLLSGFAARIRVLRKIGDPAAHARLEPEPLFELVPPLPQDNFEAIAIAPEGLGRATLYLVSDDNFSPWQRTLVLVASLRRS